MRVDYVCGVCRHVDEMENSLFFHCELSHIFWLCSPLQLNSFELEGSDFLQSWERFCNRVIELENAVEILQEFIFSLWRLWKNRNDVIFNGRHQQPIEILEAWKRNITEYRNVKEQGRQEARPSDCTIALAVERRKEQWQKLCFGEIKINTDAAWCKDTLRSRLGWVAQDFAALL